MKKSSSRSSLTTSTPATDEVSVPQSVVADTTASILRASAGSDDGAPTRRGRPKQSKAPVAPPVAPILKEDTDRTTTIDIYRGYRDTFGTTLPGVAWLSDETMAVVDTALIQTKLDEVRRRLNRGSLEPMIVNFLEWLGTSLETASVTYRIEKMMMGGPGSAVRLSEEVPKAIEQGLFKDEMKQIDIEWGHNLQVRPEIRLVGKFAALASNVHKANAKAAGMKTLSAADRTQRNVALAASTI